MLKISEEEIPSILREAISLIHITEEHHLIGDGLGGGATSAENSLLHIGLTPKNN